MKYNKRVTLISAVLILFNIHCISHYYKRRTKRKVQDHPECCKRSKSGDIIQVASGTYKENIKINKQLSILGTKYPTVYGFYYANAKAGTINGFTITKYGVSASNTGANAVIRNNYFNNCGISVKGKSASGITIMNNQIKSRTVSLYNTNKQTLTGTTISNSKFGLYVGDKNSIPTVTKCTFKNCNYGVYLYSWNQDPGKLTTFPGNKYINNKVNVGWGMKTL
jgi:parallel beta-helix repeat protein